MRVTLSASTADLDYIAGIIEKRTDRQGKVAVDRDALARLLIDHSRVLAVVRQDAVVDVLEAPTDNPEPIPTVKEIAPDLLLAMGEA
jgi:hypothetical protein